MILEEGTKDQLLDCACLACLPRPRSRWVYFRYDDLHAELRPYRYFTVRGVRGSEVLTGTNMVDLPVDQWVLLVAEGRLRQNELFTWYPKAGT